MPRLEWIQRLQTITQAGLTYARDPYDRERYEQLQALTAEIAAADDDKLFIQCRLEGGAPERSHETLDVDFFGPAALPALSQPRVTAAQVRRMFVHLEQPQLPTDFD